MYLSIMGSHAYGCADTTSSDASDMDLYGWCIPRKETLFPHLAGRIIGFDKDLGTWDQWQQHHIYDPDALGGKGRTYDFQIFNIVKFFSLLMDNNPNIIDSLFTPTNCVIHCTRIGTMVRDNRKMFLHKGAWHRFKGYAYAQLHKMSSKNPEAGSKRAKIREQYGTDVKFAYHIVRLISEVEQILTEGDLDLQRNNEQLKAIRRGEWTEQQIRDYFTQKEKSLEKLYDDSTLPYGPDIVKIKGLLLNCLEEHFGTLDKAIVVEDRNTHLLRDIKKMLEQNGI
jgi:predicted nucleotidyltransferase